MGRLTRDNILISALDMLDSAVLDAKDRPSASIVAGAFSIQWLQEGLDLLFAYVPIGGTLVSPAGTLSFSAGVPSYLLPTDFAAVEKDGVVLTDTGEHLILRNQNELDSQPTVRTNWGRPTMFSITYPFLSVRPVPNTTIAATLNYYALPTALAAGATPAFSLDTILVQYVWLRGQEWHKTVLAGTAQEYLISVATRLKHYGLALPPEPPIPVTMHRPGKVGLDPKAS